MVEVIHMEYYLISGRSMEPILRKKRDIVMVECVNIDSIKVGDIVCFYSKNHNLIENKTDIICHRIIKIYRDSRIRLLEKGDNYMDVSIVDEARLIGKAMNIIRGDQVYDMEKPRWKLCNKFFAVMSYGSYINYMICTRLKLIKKNSIDMHSKGLQYYVEASILKIINMK